MKELTTKNTASVQTDSKKAGDNLPETAPQTTDETAAPTVGDKMHKSPAPRDSKSKKRAKRLVIILCISFVVLLGMNCLTLLDFSKIFPSLFQEKDAVETKNPSISFYNIDYDEDILKDAAYLDMNRYIRYTEDSLSTLISDGNYQQYGDGVVLLSEYFYAIVHGNADAYNACFTADYLKENGKHERFTMQRLYEIEISFLNTVVIDEGTDHQITRIEYRVTYKIQSNNGTFRWDVGSDAAVPEIYEVLLYDSDNSVKINSISKYKHE